MVKCPKCGSEIEPEYNFCPKCGSEIPDPTRSFVYDQLFELMKIENERRLHLDSKAHTYIGLLSIAVTIFMALGGLLSLESISLLQSLKTNTVFLMYFMYVAIIVAFIAGVLCAFKAYHRGSLESKEFDTRDKFDKAIKENRIYIKMRPEELLNLLNERSNITKMDLILYLSKVVDVNRNINIKKSDGVLSAFKCTIVAVILLLIMTLYISVISLQIVGW